MKSIIFGATGMVGIEVLHCCLQERQFQQVITIGRKKTNIDNPKLREIEHDNFLDFTSLEPEILQADICFYCLGVYQGMVSTDKFWEITCDYLAALIESIERCDNDITFCLFSAQGADPTERSRILFAKAKGRAEKQLLDSNISRKYIFRPGYINPGQKEAKSRIPFWLIKPFYKLFPFIGIDAPDLARVMVDVGLNGHDLKIFENGDLRRRVKVLRND